MNKSKVLPFTDEFSYKGQNCKNTCVFLVKKKNEPLWRKGAKTYPRCYISSKSTHKHKTILTDVRNASLLSILQIFPSVDFTQIKALGN